MITDMVVSCAHAGEHLPREVCSIETGVLVASFWDDC